MALLLSYAPKCLAEILRCKTASIVSGWLKFELCLGGTCGTLRMDNRASSRGSLPAYSHNTRNTWSNKTYKFDWCILIKCSTFCRIIKVECCSRYRKPESTSGSQTYVSLTICCFYFFYLRRHSFRSSRRRRRLKWKSKLSVACDWWVTPCWPITEMALDPAQHTSTQYTGTQHTSTQYTGTQSHIYTVVVTQWHRDTDQRCNWGQTQTSWQAGSPYGRPRFKSLSCSSSSPRLHLQTQ